MNQLSAYKRLKGAMVCAVFFQMALAVFAVAQNTPGWQWRNITPASGAMPEPRRDGEAIYDPVGKRIILFGGNSNEGPKNDTWAFDLATRTWTKLTTVGTAPTGRLGFDAVYDPVGHQMVIYSGQGAGFFNDTWTLNLTTLQWTDVSPVSDSARPKKRYGSGAVFDPQTRSLVSFAGFTSEAGRFQDTQSFGLAGKSWSDWTPGGSKPQVRCLLTAAFDPIGRRMIIYAGQRSGALDDIWSFDLASRQWTNLTPAVRPPGRFWSTSFVNKDGRFVIFGGSGAGNFNDTWEFDLSAQRWTQLQIENPPSQRNGMMGVYIESEDRFIVIGGTGNSGNLNDVWELSRKSAATVSTVSAASFDGAMLAPESIVSAFGTNLATGTQSANVAPLPTTLAGTSVRVKDNLGAERLAPLFYVSAGQINYLIPAGTSPGAATITVTSGDGSTATGSIQIANVAPSLFTANSSGNGVPAAVVLRIRSNGLQTVEPVAEWNAALSRFVATPIDLGSESDLVYLLLFGTGLRFRSGLPGVTVFLGGQAAQVQYAGQQGDFVGLDQVNVLLPRTLIGRGEVDLMLTADGKAANTVRLSIK
ncbi:MAG: kelch repeat-containing protein [Acidobacteriota bacterium]|nr:kelch repeat-containing protein [Acidobacteriota bacterium]